MFIRMILGALFRQKGKMLMVALTVALGASLASAMLNVMLDVGDKVNRELKAYGANINVLPKGALLLSDLYGMEQAPDTPDMYLSEEDVAKVKTIFWAHNIVDFTPHLNTSGTINGGADAVKVTGTWYQKHLSLPTGEELETGIQRMRSWWDVSGDWISDEDTDRAMIGSALARQQGLELGDSFTLGVGTNEQTFTVSGIIEAGGDEDDQVFITLKTAQDMTDKQEKISSFEVSALTTPDNEIARRAAENPRSLSAKEHETWYCTAYVSSICYQIDEVVPEGVAKPIRQVAESEGTILEKTQLLMLLITVLSLLGAALGISNLISASVMERSSEIGLMKALGAHDVPLTWLVLLEILLVGLVGGLIGYFAGLGFAQIIGQTVFGAPIAAAPMVIPLLSVLVALVIIVGSLPSIRYLLSLRPAEVLHGR
ncbi:MAG: ABC transporter permease [Coriobacteriales bacterium]|jgi:putative ABC transport system permease protein|nr:ABC transporter permease [Coriobacteriales bacterium]